MGLGEINDKINYVDFLNNLSNGETSFRVFSQKGFDPFHQELDAL